MGFNLQCYCVNKRYVMGYDMIIFLIALFEISFSDSALTVSQFKILRLSDNFLILISNFYKMIYYNKLINITLHGNRETAHKDLRLIRGY